MWQPKSRMELITLENDYFLVKFSSVCDYEYAKFGGPWMIMEHYLIVKEWMPNFDPYTDSTEKVIVWVRLPDLPIEYYDHDFLFRIGEKIGKPMKIDSATSLTSRGKFARLCVEVDITKPLLAKFWLRRKVRRIEYEGIHLVCFNCGIYGHSQDACNKERPGGMEVAGESPEKVDEAQRNTSGSEKGKNQVDIMMQLIRPEITDSYGPGMIAQKNQRRQNQGQTRKEGAKAGGNMQGNNGQEVKKSKESGNKGSRFVVLEEVNMEEQLRETIKEESWAKNRDNDAYSGPSKTTKNKSKRPTVQINEKQVSNENNNIAGKSNENNGEANGVKEVQGPRARTRNQAGAAEEHIVVRGEKHGAVITSTRILNHMESQLLHGIPDLYMQEHHNDPPHAEQGIDLNFTVNENGLFEEGANVGNGASGSGVQCMEC